MIKEKIENLLLYRKAKSIYKKYERQVIPGMLVFGFVADVITFRSININLAFVLLIIHIILVGFTIAFINIYDTHWLEGANKLTGYIRLASPLAMQFSFGALLSAAFIFYSFGGVFSVSWPLILTIFFLMISNEVFKQSYLKPVVQLNVFFFVLITFFSLFFPFVFNSISPWIFVLSGAFSLLVIFVYIHFVIKKAPKIKEKQKWLTASILLIFIFINSLYFWNIIPPIPLSLRDHGIYYSVRHVGQNYELTAEKQSILQKIIPGTTIRVVNNKPIYIFTSVFSPTELNTEIVHHWQKYNEAESRWVTVNKLAFPIFGGRSDGYRGYSVSSNVSPGKWRVFVETKRGQVLGKISFQVKQAEQMPEMEVVTK